MIFTTLEEIKNNRCYQKVNSDTAVWLYFIFSYLLGQFSYEFSMFIGSPLVRQHPLLGIL